MVACKGLIDVRLSAWLVRDPANLRILLLTVILNTRICVHQAGHCAHGEVHAANPEMLAEHHELMTQ